MEMFINQALNFHIRLLDFYIRISRIVWYVFVDSSAEATLSKFWFNAHQWIIDHSKWYIITDGVHKCGVLKRELTSVLFKFINGCEIAMTQFNFPNLTSITFPFLTSFNFIFGQSFGQFGIILFSFVQFFKTLERFLTHFCPFLFQYE